MAGESLIANERVGTLKEKLTGHPIYESVETLQDLRCFMEHHIYAVWDFMSLLKALQSAVAPAQTPWMPSSRPELRRFINEIVLGEECDEYDVAETKRFISHFELYLLSMEEVRADTRPIRQFISVVNENGVEAALGLPIVPQPAIEFVRSTFRVWLPIFTITLNATHNSTPKHTARSLSNWWPPYVAKTTSENRKRCERPKKLLRQESFFGTELRRRLRIQAWSIKQEGHLPRDWFSGAGVHPGLARAWSPFQAERTGLPFCRCSGL